MGIWKRDLGNQLNIDKKELTKRLSSMEKRKLIKKISSNVDGNMKIRFILFGIEPDSSITGGAFVDGDRFDKELVEVRMNFVSLPRVGLISWLPSNIKHFFRIVHICWNSICNRWEMKPIKRRRLLSMHIDWVQLALKPRPNGSILWTLSNSNFLLMMQGNFLILWFWKDLQSNKIPCIERKCTTEHLEQVAWV